VRCWGAALGARRLAAGKARRERQRAAATEGDASAAPARCAARSAVGIGRGRRCIFLTPPIPHPRPTMLARSALRSSLRAAAPSAPRMFSSSAADRHAVAVLGASGGIGQPVSALSARRPSAAPACGAVQAASAAAPSHCTVPAMLTRPCPALAAAQERPAGDVAAPLRRAPRARCRSRHWPREHARRGASPRTCCTAGLCTDARRRPPATRPTAPRAASRRRSRAPSSSSSPPVCRASPA
jgi:hypothetical protein